MLALFGNTMQYQKSFEFCKKYEYKFEECKFHKKMVEINPKSKHFKDLK